jgi:predicted adenine nucleotide alpha hydrolase (AANH) superfamily ATPase
LFEYPDRFKDVQGHSQERSIYQVYDEELMRAAAAREREVVEKRLRDAAEEAQAKAEEMLTLVFNTSRKREIKKLEQKAKGKWNVQGVGLGL